MKKINKIRINCETVRRLKSIENEKEQNKTKQNKQTKNKETPSPKDGRIYDKTYYPTSESKKRKKRDRQKKILSTGKKAKTKPL